MSLLVCFRRGKGQSHYILQFSAGNPFVSRKVPLLFTTSTPAGAGGKGGNGFGFFVDTNSELVNFGTIIGGSGGKGGDAVSFSGAPMGPPDDVLRQRVCCQQEQTQ